MISHWISVSDTEFLYFEWISVVFYWFGMSVFPVLPWFVHLLLANRTFLGFDFDATVSLLAVGSCLYSGFESYC